MTMTRKLLPPLALVGALALVPVTASSFAAADTANYQPDLQDWGPIVVPANSYFMMGDNREESHDSRTWGFLPRENVQGTPMFIYYSYNGESWRSMPWLTDIRWNRFFHRPR